MGRRYRSHVLDVYHANLHLTTSRKAWTKLRRTIDSLDKKPDGLGMTTLQLYESTGHSVPHLVWFIDVDAHGDNFNGLIETCAHEAVHGAGLLLDHFGQDYNGRSEHHAYLVGWLTRWLWEGCGKAIDPALIGGA